MGKKTKIYVDTSAFIAFLDRSDTFCSLFTQLFSDPPELITSTLVIAEGHGWFLKRYDQTRALQFLDFIEDLKILQVMAIGSNEIQEATKYLRKFSDQDLTLADAWGLWVMERCHAPICWSTDRHLGLTGIPLAIHSH